jgi:hypothetical protein
MKLALLALTLFALADAASAAEISSVYTDLDADKDCATVEEEGNGAILACSGFKGFPVVIHAGDLRESIFYGFPPEGDPVWESFGPFNSAGAKVEWRIRTDGASVVPLATIHRWTVSDPEDSSRNTEVLVVEKVGQIDERQGCAVGLVVASGNPNANEMARTIADEAVAGFSCGADERILVGQPMPDFSRGAAGN